MNWRKLAGCAFNLETNCFSLISSKISWHNIVICMCSSAYRLTLASMEQVVYFFFFLFFFFLSRLILSSIFNLVDFVFKIKFHIVKFIVIINKVMSNCVEYKNFLEENSHCQTDGVSSHTRVQPVVE